jgi:hypothetical protein
MMTSGVFVVECCDVCTTSVLMRQHGGKQGSKVRVSTAAYRFQDAEDHNHKAKHRHWMSNSVVSFAAMAVQALCTARSNQSHPITEHLCSRETHRANSEQGIVIRSP